MYIGVTNNLVGRLYEHQNGLVDGFTKKYKVKMLVYFESTEDIISAIAREKALKKLNGSWKISLIQSVNPEWNDLSIDL